MDESIHRRSLPSTTDDTQMAHYFFYQRSEYPKDCRDVQSQCSTSISSGVYIIKPDGFEDPFEVYCNNDVGGGGWTVIQRRESGAVNFNRSWSQYQDGFGFLSTEFWLGNEKLSYLTNQADYELRVDIELSNGASFYTTYKGFRITDEWGQYKVTHIGALESNASTLISTCPTNMIYGTCTCQATCEDPNGQSGCNSDCTEGCTCPAGFLLQGVTASVRVNAGVSWQRPTWLYQNEIRECYCNEGYEGDGENLSTLRSYRDCQDVYDADHRQDGVYTIMPTGWPGIPFDVHCKMENGGGWTVFQRRTDGSTSFDQDWDAYKDGFGDSRNLWLGNEKLHYLTNQRNYKLRFDITTSSGSAKYAEYTEFQVESESNKYRMNKLGTRSGNTGYHLSYNKGKQFSTHERDNDECDTSTALRNTKAVGGTRIVGVIAIVIPIVIISNTAAAASQFVRLTTSMVSTMEPTEK
ncbi:putative ficolin-2-like [Apostichopus japonicus]|uniref:Putative ficolin-2-like n=1 Tax=Stichopus japonicus TaxID=307972 RepID=A0A2G8LAC8_STIJA|nr:putative ficolin-2-like [Apostichopus japonicus]